MLLLESIILENKFRYESYIEKIKGLYDIARWKMISFQDVIV